ncbi:MAG TPA: aspartate kinase [Planctomycetota bacterium]|nr:aspartate kinase [Planctomycetota bacterium]
MRILVQKFGGTSLADADRVLAAARRTARAVAEGWSVIVVVSAMAGETNRLLKLASQFGNGTDRRRLREVDALVATGEEVSAALMALALQSLDVRARSLTAHQVLLRCDGRFQNARIRSVDSEELRSLLEKGSVPVVTGFQGIDDEGNVATLGRGGSDTTAVALAVAISAEECEIFTDVEGVYTTDPNLCPEARKLHRIACEDMLELASLGAKVLQIRSVELAMKGTTRIHVRSTFTDREGTMITPGNNDLEAPVVTGIACDMNQARVTIVGLKDRPDLLAKVFEPLARDEISVDLITQNLAADGSVTVTFTLEANRLDAARTSIDPVVHELQGREAQVDRDVAKVSAVGIGMRTHAGVAQKMFAILSGAGIPIRLAVSTEIKVSCVVPSNCGAQAVRLLHAGFGLAA